MIILYTPITLFSDLVMASLNSRQQPALCDLTDYIDGTGGFGLARCKQMKLTYL